MDMLSRDAIAAADLADWRKLGQGLHARFRTPGFAAATGFLDALAAAVPDVGGHARVTLGADVLDVKLISDDATYRDGDGGEHVVEWVTRRDVDLAREVSQLAASHGLTADPAGITTLELALDTADAARVAAFWSVLLTGSTDARGRGSLGDDVRDASGRVPILWFQETDAHAPPRQRFHLDVWVAPEVADERIAAAVAAGGTVVDAGQAPSFTVLADADGNKACVCTWLPAATEAEHA